MLIDGGVIASVAGASLHFFVPIPDSKFPGRLYVACTGLATRPQLWVRIEAIIAALTLVPRVHIQWTNDDHTGDAAKRALPESDTKRSVALVRT